MTQTLQLPVPREHPLHPSPAYHQLTAEQRVVKARTPRGADAWLITKFDDVRAVLLDPRFSSDPRSPGYPSYLVIDAPPLPGFFMLFDNPDHDRLRGAVSREFLTGRMEALRPRMREALDELMDAMVGKGRSTELIQELAVPMAAHVLCEFLGVPPGDVNTVKGYVDVIEDRTASPDRVMNSGLLMLMYFQQLIVHKEQSPGDDLLSVLVRGIPGNGIQRTEMVGVASMLLLAGYDPMVQMIGLGVLTLLEHPQQLTELINDEALVAGAVDEILRFLTVNQAGLPRAALADVEIGGQLIRAGEGVLVMIDAANRDAATFPDPDTFDIHREARRHVAFGHGLHKCIGLGLARIAMETVFFGLFKRLPGLRLTSPIQSLSFRHNMVLYGLNELPVAW